MKEKTNGLKRVLFLCTGNSCRSQMAQVILNQSGQNKFAAFSAGSKPAGRVHPLALQILEEARLKTGGLRSKSWEEFKNQKFDFVITVCDRAKESCPLFPGNAVRLHWSFEDPAEAAGTGEEKLRVFRRVFNEIQSKITDFLSQNRHCEPEGRSNLKSPTSLRLLRPPAADSQ